MTKAINTHTPSRRGLLTGTAALLAGATIAATPGASAAAAPVAHQNGGTNPDAELIAVCNRYVEIEEYFETRYGDEDIDVDDPALWEQPALIDKAVILRASTLQGHAARAKMMVRYVPAFLIMKEAWETDDNLVAAMLRDLTGEVQV